MKRVIKNLYTLKGAKATERTNELRTQIGLAAEGETSSEFIEHSLATAANDFLVASGSGVYVKKTLAQTKAILYGTATPTVIDIPATSTRAIRVGTKGTTYANSTALKITSIGGTLDTEPANNYLVGVFSKVQGNENTGATDDLGSAWFRTRTDTAVTTPAGYSLYGVKSQLRIYSTASAGATSISNWAAAGMLGVLEVSGAATTFESGCIAAAVYANVALGTGSTIAEGAVVAGIASISASSAMTNSENLYFGVYVGKSGAVLFDVGVFIAAGSVTTGISISSATTGINISSATTGINIGTVATGINISSATTGISINSAINLFSFDSISGCVLGVDVNPKDVPSGGGLGADACIRVDIGGADYFIPLFAVELS